MLALAITSSLSAAASAQEAWRLEHEAPSEGCPDEEAFRDRTIARLGYEPFVDSDAPRRAVVRIERDGARFRGWLTLYSGDERIGARELSAERCDTLADTLAAALAIAIDPTGMGSAPPRERPPEPPAPAPDPERPPVLRPAVTEEPAAAAPHLVLAAFFRSGAGLAPGPTLGAEIAAAVRWDALEIGVQGRFESTFEVQWTPTDRVEASVLTGAAVACIAGFVVGGCALVELGQLRTTALDVVDPRPVETFYAAIALRGHVQIQLPPVELVAGVELSAPLVHAAFFVSGREVWTTPPLAGALRLGAAWTVF
jgi:hypothetical protein